jgi:lipid-binding SYLF domain-containing protein
MGLGLALALSASAADPEVEGRLRRSAAALRSFRGNASEPARQLLDRAMCVGIVPKRIPGEPEGVGRGFVSCLMPGTAQRTWSSPAAIIIDNGLVWPFEGAARDFIFVAPDRASATRLAGSDVFIGVELQARPGPVLPENPALPVNYPVIYSWVQSGASINGVQISGAGISSDKEANQGLYGRTLETAAILKMPGNQDSQAASEFLAELPTQTQSAVKLN